MSANSENNTDTDSASLVAEAAPTPHETDIEQQHAGPAILTSELLPGEALLWSETKSEPESTRGMAVCGIALGAVLIFFTVFACAVSIYWRNGFLLWVAFWLMPIFVSIAVMLFIGARATFHRVRYFAGGAVGVTNLRVLSVNRLGGIQASSLFGGTNVLSVPVSSLVSVRHDAHGRIVLDRAPSSSANGNTAGNPLGTGADSLPVILQASLSDFGAFENALSRARALPPAAPIALVPPSAVTDVEDPSWTPMIADAIRRAGNIAADQPFIYAAVVNPHPLFGILAWAELFCIVLLAIALLVPLLVLHSYVIALVVVGVMAGYMLVRVAFYVMSKFYGINRLAVAATADALHAIPAYGANADSQIVSLPFTRETLFPLLYVVGSSDDVQWLSTSSPFQVVLLPQSRDLLRYAIARALFTAPSTTSTSSSTTSPASVSSK